jgi:hypothetical protein
MKKINQYKRTYHKEKGALLGLIIIFILFILPMIYQNDTTVEVIPTVSVATTSVSFEDKIKQYFPKNYPTMIAIAHAESRMDNNQKNYNCFYNKNETIVYQERVKGSHSTSCKKGHERYAWSTDCFLLQKNYKGKNCPADVTLDDHLKDVSELSKVQGLEAWSAYKNGSYLTYLK